MKPTNVDERALYVAVYSAVLGSDPMRDHAKAREEARRAVKECREDLDP